MGFYFWCILLLYSNFFQLLLMRSNMAENIGWNILKSDKIWCQWVSERHSVVSDSLPPHGLNSPWNSPGQNTGVGSCCLLHGIFPTQGSNPGLQHCRHILTSWATRESLSIGTKFLPWIVYIPYMYDFMQYFT